MTATVGVSDGRRPVGDRRHAQEGTRRNRWFNDLPHRRRGRVARHRPDIRHTPTVATSAFTPAAQRTAVYTNLAHTGIGAALLTVTALVLTGAGAAFRWIGRRR